MTKDEALKLALEALEAIYTVGDVEGVVTPNGTIYLLPAITAIKEALAQPEQCQCPNCKVTLHASDCAVHNEPAYPKGACNCGAQPEQEFFTHCVDQPYDWSEWVCPDPKSYLFKCCDCGLVHEAEFGVVRYKSDTDREDCDMLDDPNLQAVFRMRRSEQWSPEDTAHRAGGLSMAQPEQEPVGKLVSDEFDGHRFISYQNEWPFNVDLYTTQPQRKPLTDDEIWKFWLSPPEIPEGEDDSMEAEFVAAVRRVLAAHGIKERP